jgi:hypothetical protein
MKANVAAVLLAALLVLGCGADSPTAPPLPEVCYDQANSGVKELPSTPCPAPGELQP